MRSALGFLLFALAPAFAAIDGTVINGTTGQPASGVTVNLVQPGSAGMQTLGSVQTDDAGKFTFAQDPSGAGPTLVQGVFKGVTYTKFLPPGTPSSGLRLEVFDATSKRSAFQISQDMILLQPAAGQLSVAESLLVENSGKLSYNDPAKGSVQFYVPPEAKGGARVQVNGPGGMPIPRPAEPTGQPNVFRVSYPIRPGETRVDITYAIPPATPIRFSGKVMHSEGKTRLVTPNGVTLKGADITPVGQEPTTQASIYDIKGKTFTVEVEGAGQFQPQNDAGTAAGEDSGMPDVKSVPPRIYSNIYLILGLALGVLGLGSFLLYRNGEGSARKS